MKKDKIKAAVKTNTSPISTIVQGAAIIIFGAALIFRSGLVVGMVNIVLFSLLCFIVVFQLIDAVGKMLCGLGKEAAGVFIRGLITAGVTFFLFSKPGVLWAILPLGLGVTALLCGITHFITFWQYRKESSVHKLSHLFSAVAGVIFGVWVLGSLFARIDTALWIFGIYMIFYGTMVLIDGIDNAITPEKKIKIKKRIRITLPLFIAALIPVRVQSKINEYFKSEYDGAISLRATENKSPNVEILVHVSSKGFGAMGHVDLAVNGRVISYGGYDEGSMKLFGSVGPGVIFTVEDKEKYIKFCKEESQKMIFGFGICMSEEELGELLREFDRTLEISQPWCPPKDGLYAQKLAENTDAEMYKVSRGQFKYYFVMGQNCVKYADHLLKASGFPGVMSGVISPGTYYDYLTKEYNSATGVVITRDVY